MSTVLFSTNRSNRMDEHNPGQRNRAFAFRQFLRVVGGAGDKMVSFAVVELPTARRVVKWERFVLQRCQLLAPFSDLAIVSNPNFSRLRVEFVTQTKGENLISLPQKIMGIGVLLWIGSESIEELGERVVGTNGVLRHGGKMA